jgi:exonuclease SbcC
MYIEKVELKNIKPYKTRTFEFASGINVLSGPNGSGKSTVFEAIGYALFGVEAKKFIGKAERFVHKGARQGLVRVHFRTDDGRRYVVERKAGTSTLRRLAEKRADGIEEFLEVKDDRELQLELKKILNLTADAGDLADQFLNVIGPLQNEFLGPFVKRGQPRTDEFDRILGISAWREAFTASRELEKEAKNVIDQGEKVLVEKRQQVSNYDQVVADLKTAQHKLAEKQDDLKRVSEATKQVADQLVALDHAKAELDQLERQLNEQREQKAKQEVTKQATEQRLMEAREAKKICDENAANHAAYSLAEETLKQLRERQQVAEGLRRKFEALDKQIAAGRSKIEADENNLTERERKSTDGLRQTQEQLSQAKQQLQAIETEGQRAKVDLEAYDRFTTQMDAFPTPSSIRDAAGRLIDEVVTVTAEIAAHHQRLSDRATLEAKVEEAKALEENLDELVNARASLDARRAQLEEGDQKLAGGQCPFFEERCLNLQQKAEPPANFFGQRLAALASEQQAVARQIERVTVQLQDARAAQTALAGLREVEKQLTKTEERKRRLMAELEETMQPYASAMLIRGLREWVESSPPPQDELRRVLEQAGSFEFHQPEDLQQLKEAIDVFTHRFDDLMSQLRQAAETRRAELDKRYRQARERYSAKSAERKKIEESLQEFESEQQQVVIARAKLQEARQALDKKIGERDALAEEMRQYEDLPDRIAEQENIRSAHQPGYAAFEQNKKLAAQVERLEQEVKTSEAKIAELNEHIARQEKKVASARSAYDEKAHQEARERQTALAAEQAVLSTEVKNLTAEVDRLEAEKGRMDEIRRAIREMETEIKQYKRTLRFIEDLRANVFNKVSEQLSERFREEVSHIADRIYRAIAASDEELRWGPDYRIELVDFHEGKERVRYDEELSGGETVNAVVALRLALLQTTGSKIGFFDEPTSNLDETRRANLAQAFRSLDVGQGEVGEPWYDQLFLISHDVTFTEITDQIIHLAREDREA